MRLVVKCFLNLSHSRPNFSFVLILPEFFGVTLINKITSAVQRKSGDCECNYNGLHGWIPVDRPPHTYVSGLLFSNTSSACCTVCSPPKVKSPSITTYPPFTLFHLPHLPFRLVSTVLLSVTMFFLHLLHPAPQPLVPLTAVSLFLCTSQRALYTMI